MWEEQEKILCEKMLFHIRETMLLHGFKVRRIEKIKFITAVHIFGRCRKHDDNNATIYLSEVSLRDGSIKNTIIHELCHAVMFPNNVGHNTVWQKIAKEAGKIFGENITTRAQNNEKTREYQFNKYKYIIKCENCGRQYFYIRKSKAISAIINNSKSYRCKCGSHNLRVILNR